VIVIGIREQVPVHVEGHLNAAVSEDRLQPLRRKSLLD
jgi:hypothetical protein